MKQFSSLYALAFASLSAVGCASAAAALPPPAVSSTGQACTAVDGYLVTSDTRTYTRGVGPQGPVTPVVNVDSSVLQGRGYSATESASVPARTVARTELGRGGTISCE